MKKRIVFIIILFCCSVANAVNKDVVSEADQIYLGEYVLSVVKNGANIKGRAQIDTNEYIDLFTALASLKSDIGYNYLVKCLPYYKGSAPGAFYNDLLAKQDTSIRSILNKHRKTNVICDPKLYKCYGSTVSEILYKIESKKYSAKGHDNIGDPFSYWSIKMIQNKINQIKKYK